MASADPGPPWGQGLAMASILRSHPWQPASQRMRTVHTHLLLSPGTKDTVPVLQGLLHQVQGQAKSLWGWVSLEW